MNVQFLKIWNTIFFFKTSRKNNVVPINGESNQMKYRGATITTFPYILIYLFDKAEIRAITQESKW